MSQKAMTPAERKAREREAKRSQGLVLKQIWVPPEAWPLLRDLSTNARESIAYGVWSGTSEKTGYGNEVDADIAFYYERANEFLTEEMAWAEATVGPEKAPEHVSGIIRAVLKTFDKSRRAPQEMVIAIKKEME